MIIVHHFTAELIFYSIIHWDSITFFLLHILVQKLINIYMYMFSISLDLSNNLPYVHVVTLIKTILVYFIKMIRHIYVSLAPAANIGHI